MPRRKSKKNEDFFSSVYNVTMQIPYGRVTSYGAIARYLGSGSSARTVGWALNASHNTPEFIPAHRVVNRIGLLTGKFHFGNTTTMQQLLENEGIIVENDRIVNFVEKFWDPLSELS
jgi:methylated-DNA-protein-cysteine methyltransferase-like protein